MTAREGGNADYAGALICPRRDGLRIAAGTTAPTRAFGIAAETAAPTMVCGSGGSGDTRRDGFEIWDRDPEDRSHKKSDGRSGALSRDFCKLKEERHA